MNLLKVAAVIEATALHLDSIEAEKAASVNAERQTMIDKLASKYTEATGDDMPEAIRLKLASSDQDVVRLLESMVEKNASQVESLGGPSVQDDDKEPQTKKEAAVAADDRFLNWIQS